MVQPFSCRVGFRPSEHPQVEVEAAELLAQRGAGS
jgi:hypothetical protein